MIAFVDGPPELSELNGLVRLGFKSGGDDMPVAMTQHDLRHLIVRGNRLLNKIAERQQQQVIDFASEARQRK